MTAAKKKERWTVRGHLKQYWFVYFFILGVIAFWAATPLLMTWANERFFKDADVVRLGPFGDMFGYINALFSGLAFAGIIASILLQSRELKLQREELAETREVALDSKTQLSRQADALNQQLLENIFFSMMRLHNDIVNDITAKSNMEIVVTGRSALRVLRNSFHHTPGLQDGNATIDEVIERYFEGIDLRHLVRNLYNIFGFVEEIPADRRQIYISIVRAQLSSSERFLLCLYGASEEGSRKRGFLEQNRILEGLNPHDEHIALVANRYQPLAFGV